MELRLDDLMLDGLKIYQYKDGYNFTSDSVLLANFVSTKKSSRCVEIGTGSGIISILVSHKQQPQKIYAFEIQKKYSDLAKKNIEYNKIGNIEVINDDIENFSKYLGAEVDVVFCNPPYFSGEITSQNEEIALSRHQKYLPLEKLAKVSSKLLKFGGSFFVVYPAEKLCELICALVKYNLIPKKIFFAQPNLQKNANTVYVMCKKGGKFSVKVMPVLVTNDLDGNYVQTIQKLYRDEVKR